MLSLAVVTPHHGRTYYQKDNYYSKDESIEYSQWAGQGAAMLNLEGVVDPKIFARIISGKETLVSMPSSPSGKQRAGLDLTFSAPKSVSVQALIFGDESLAEAHRKAVSEALEYVEKNYAFYRSGSKKAREAVRGSGLIVAQFEHDTSRARDPQLHTHNVVLNRVLDENGNVRALFNDPIYRDSKLIGLVYQNALARRVRALGFDIKQNRNGTFEIEGFSEENLRVFSKRRAQLESLGATDQKSATALIYKNRQSKEGPQTRSFLLESWRVEAKANGVQYEKPANKAKLKSMSIGGLVRSAIRQASERDVSFRQQKILESALVTSLGDHDLAKIESAIEGEKGSELIGTKKKDMLTTVKALRVEAESRILVAQGKGKHERIASSFEIDDRLKGLRRLDPESARTALQSARTTLSENSIQSQAFDKQTVKLQKAIDSGSRIPLAEITEVRIALKEDLKSLPKKESANLLKEVMFPIERQFQSLTQGQQRAIETTLTSKDRVVIWQGVAGSGKTYSMRQIVNLAQAKGFEVAGFAPSATAAIQLSRDAGIEATTLQSHLLRREVQSEESKPKIWIVDEAGMVSANDMLRLLRKAEIFEARVLLVGDTRQLSPIDSGNPFLDLQRKSGTTVVSLDESVRQKDPTLQRAVARMNEGHVDVAMGILADSVATRKTSHGRVKLAVQEYLALDDKERNSTLVLARTNTMREEGTTLIRDALKERGVLKNESSLLTFERIDLHAERMQFASAYSVGDLAVPNRSLKDLGLVKDEAYEVYTKIGSDIVLKKDGKLVRVDVSAFNSFSLFRPKEIPIAEGDKMIWNRNRKDRDQFNNREFEIVGVNKDNVAIKNDDGETLTLNLKDRHFAEHAWVMTVHKSQGQTKSRVIQIVDATSRKQDLLVGVTRAVNDVFLVAESHAKLRKQAAVDATKATASSLVEERHVQVATAQATQIVEQRKAKKKGRSM